MLETKGGLKDDGFLPWIVHCVVENQMKWGPSDSPVPAEARLVKSSSETAMTCVLCSVETLLKKGIEPCDAQDFFKNPKGREFCENATKLAIPPGGCIFVPYGNISIFIPLLSAKHKLEQIEIVEWPLLVPADAKSATAPVRRAIQKWNSEFLSRHGGKAEWKPLAKAYTAYEAECAS